MRLCAFCSEVGAWQLVSYKHWESGMCCTSRSYLWNCNRFLCSRHGAASKDFSKIGCGCLWSLWTVTFTYGNVVTELRAGKNSGWALFFNLCVMLLNLWECPGMQGRRSGESTPLPPMWRGLDSQIRRQLRVEFIGSPLCTERFSPGTPVLSDRGILKNDFFPFQ